MADSVKVAISCEDGSVAVMTFMTRGRGPAPFGAVEEADRGKKTGWWVRDPSQENIFAEILRAFAPSPTKPAGFRVVEDAQVPQDRVYRDAWIDDGQSIVHDMPKARELHRGLLRHARSPLLAALDVEGMRADESGNARRRAEVIAEKQRLRDITDHPDIEAAKSIDELRAVRLGVL